MDLTDLKDIIKDGESETLEFKERLPKPSHEIGKTLTAFANTSGGYLLIGISNDGRIVGIDDADKITITVTNIARRCQPPLRPKIISIHVNANFYILCVKVVRSSLTTYEGRAYIRVSSSNHPAEGNELRGLVKEYGNKNSSSSIGLKAIDVVIPVGPMEIDKKKMNSVEGIKLMAEIPRDGAKTILHKLLDSLRPIIASIGRVYILTIMQRGDKNWNRLGGLINGISSRNPWSSKLRLISGNGDMRWGLVSGLSHLELSPWFLLHYSDVWPHDPKLYGQLLANLRASMNNKEAERHGYQGAFACATKIPFNYLSRSQERSILKSTAHLKWVTHVAKPFHRVKVQVTRFGDSPIYLHLTNMAIAILSSAIAKEIGKQRKKLRKEKNVSTEFFDIINSLDDCYFDVVPYFGDWTHADSDEDLEIIRYRARINK